MGAVVEASVPSSVSFLTMPWRTAVARCASTAVSVRLLLPLLESGPSVIDPAAVAGSGKATSICPVIRLCVVELEIGIREGFPKRGAGPKPKRREKEFHGPPTVGLLFVGYAAVRSMGGVQLCCRATIRRLFNPGQSQSI